MRSIFSKVLKKFDKGKWVSINSNKIDSIINDVVDNYGKDYCLNIGAGKETNKLYTTVDIDKEAKPDIYGDIRALFAPDKGYAELLKEYPLLYDIQSEFYAYVRLCHIVEHIEWLYLPKLFEWVHGILSPSGMISIDTPNLEYICKAYIKFLEFEDRGELPVFPAKEHPDLSVQNVGDMQEWINFKLYSGCSRGDYHHCCLDKNLLWVLLNDAGFDKVYIHNGSTLRAIAYKGIRANSGNRNTLEDELAKLGVQNA